MASRDPYAKGHSDGFRVNDRVNKPLTIPLTPEYVRELVDDPYCETTLLDKAERMVEAKAALPDWLIRELIKMGRMGRAPRDVRHERTRIWYRAVGTLKSRFGLKENAAINLVARDGAIKTSFDAVKRAMQRLKSGK